VEPLNVSSPTDRRQFGRRATCLHAVITAKGRPTVFGVVRDISDGGCRIEVQSAPWVPSRFTLTVHATNFKADCEVVYRDGSRVGVEFCRQRGAYNDSTADGKGKRPRRRERGGAQGTRASWEVRGCDRIPGTR
jgi:hypothetical protein